MTVLQQAGVIAVPIQNAEDRVEYDEYGSISAPISTSPRELWDT